MDAGERKLPTNLILRNGIYHVRLEVNGKDVWRSTRHRNERDAIKRADELKVALRKGEGRTLTRVPTFAEWAQTYQDVYSAVKASPRRDAATLAPAVKHLGKLKLDRIPRTTVQHYLNIRGRTVKKSTLTTERQTLQAMFEMAVEEGLLVKNPLRRKKGEPRPKVPARIRLLAREHEPLLLGALRLHLQRFVTFLLYTGLRITEAINLTPKHINRFRNLIEVPAEFAKGKKAREVPLWPEAWTAVREELAARSTEGQLWFHDASYYDKLLKAGAEAVGIPHLSAHDLRHTFATRYLLGGGDIFDLSKILGHSSVKVTEEYYAHLTADDVSQRSLLVDLTATSRSKTRSDRQNTEILEEIS